MTAPKLATQLCRCGCGLPTRVPTRNRPERGEYRGQPLPYRAHHEPRPIAEFEDRFWRHVTRTDGCWLWTGTKNSDNYPQFYVGLNEHGQSRYVPAHRWIYERKVSPIPTGYTVDHVATRGCTSTLCVRPDHLEAVTNVENVMRGNGACVRNAAKTHCHRGHAFTPENTDIYRDPRGRKRRICRTCRALLPNGVAI